MEQPRCTTSGILLELRHGHATATGFSTISNISDVATCGALARDLALETTGLGFPIGLLVWLRESTFSRSASSGVLVPIL